MKNGIQRGVPNWTNIKWKQILLFSIKFKTSNFDPPIDQMTKIRLEIQPLKTIIILHQWVWGFWG